MRFKSTISLILVDQPTERIFLMVAGRQADCRSLSLNGKLESQEFLGEWLSVEIQARPIKANSILFVCIGSTIGKIAQNTVECATNQQINSLVPALGYSNEFIYSNLERNIMQIIWLAGKQAVPIVNKTVFSDVTLFFPKLPEQQKIAACLSSLDELIAAQAQKIEALKMHKKGLMQQLFPAADQVQG